MANKNNITKTITEFREEISSRGLQRPSLYEVIFNQTGRGNPIACYPLSVILPGRQFTYYNHDIWGPTRKIPYKRGYTQCNISFIIHDDWSERAYLESWANSVIRNAGGPSNIGEITKLTEGKMEPTVEEVTRSIEETSTSANPSTGSSYNDYSNYFGGLGTVKIRCLNSKDRTIVNREITLREAYPAVISPVTLAADGTGYATFNCTFQFRDYIFS